MTLARGHDDEHLMTISISDPRIEARTRPERTDTLSADPVDDVVDIWGKDSFPASDPPSNW
jgi:hypothetical protein